MFITMFMGFCAVAPITHTTKSYKQINWDVPFSKIYKMLHKGKNINL